MTTFGADPEFMITRDGEYCSAIGVVQGDKENRIKIQGHQFFWDNVMAECAVKPSRSKKEALENFREFLGIYTAMVRPYELTVQASQIYPDSELQHEGARKVGCAPDWCAYEMKLKDAPKDEIKNGNFRSCGGHIHLGDTGEVLQTDGEEPLLVVHMLDLFLGVPSLWLDRDPSSPARRRLYGQAGRYRVTDYGIEYRSLGNFWLQSPQLVGLIYDLAMFAVEFVRNGSVRTLWSFDEEIYWDADDLSDAFTCVGYDPHQLKVGIDSGSQELVESHWKLAQSLLPPSLLHDIERSSNACGGDLYDNWQL